MTGAFGRTAESIVSQLVDAGHVVHGVDLPGVPPPPDRVFGSSSQLDVADLEALAPSVTSMDVAVHLAVAVGAGDYLSPDTPFRTNVQGTYAVLEAARRAGVGRVILIGSAPVHLPTGDVPVDPRSRLPCDSGADFLYDVTKSLQEELGRQFAETHGLTVLNLRAGHVVDGAVGRDLEGRPLSELDYCRGGWVCRHDLARAVVAALSWEGTGYEAFHVIGSRAARERFDVGKTERELGIGLKADFSDFA
ncbi:MAG: NAD(P)-dependent oxidoreductase [Acidobacteriota bacterium]